MAMQQKGIIKTWRDDKGFGFIRPEDGSKEIFFHVSDIINRQSRPAVNAEVRYRLTYDQQQRPRATDISFADLSTGSMPSASGSLTIPIMPSIIVSIFFLVLILATVIVHLSPIVVVLYGVMSLVTFSTYRKDKISAEHGQWRTSENWLHLLELCGGWPGALIAQAYYRHKTIKSSYQMLFWLIILLNLVALTLYCVASVTLFKR